MPKLEASVSNVKGLSKSGNDKTGACVMANLSESNVVKASLLHRKLSFFNISVKGVMINA